MIPWHLYVNCHNNISTKRQWQEGECQMRLSMTHEYKSAIIQKAEWKCHTHIMKLYKKCSLELSAKQEKLYFRYIFVEEPINIRPEPMKDPIWSELVVDRVTKVRKARKTVKLIPDTGSSGTVDLEDHTGCRWAVYSFKYPVIFFF